MNRAYRITCLLAVSCLAVWGIGCSSKMTRSSGETTRASMSDRTDHERVSPGIVLAKADPSMTKRQMDDMRAEQLSTAAAGLRDVFFAYDSWTISEEGRQALTRDADWLRAHGKAQVKVEGHCDERGSSTYNFVLAEKRAKSVRNYLMALGVHGDRVAIVSYGKERPFCTEHSESCHRQNRRGHMVVKP
jgi:peptidoglycan-associated lipoprotein